MKAKPNHGRRKADDGRLIEIERISLSLWKNLDRLRNELGLDHRELAALLALSHEEYVNMKKSREPLSLFSLLAISKSLGLQLEIIAEGGFKPTVLKRCRARLPQVLGTKS